MCRLPRPAPQHAIALLRGEKIMKQLGLGIIVALGLTLPAFANPPQLRGDYVFTYNDTCLVSPSGFSAPPGLAPAGAAALGQTYSSSGADTGIEHFNDDGRTGFVKPSGINVSLGSPPLPANVGPSTSSFQFTYVYNSDDTFTMTTVPGTFVGSIPGTNPPLSFSINGNRWLGKVSNDAKSHTLTTVTPFIQVITVNTNPPTTPTIIPQMCRSNVLAFKLNPTD
jgi:hypothetical protein